MRMILAGVGCILLLAVAFTVLKGQDPTSTTPDTDSKAEQVEQRADSALPVQIMKPQRQDRRAQRLPRAVRGQCEEQILRSAQR